MIPKLSNDQRQPLDVQDETYIYVEDDKRHTVCVILPMHVFQQLRPLFEPDTFNLPDSYPLQEEVAASAGWNDPAMSDYDALRPSPAP